VDVTVADLVRLDARARARYTERRGLRMIMRMERGHCAALHVRQGHYSCRVYGRRPEACRIVTPGSVECLDARRRRGVEG
jgi:hypothetical protein